MRNTIESILSYLVIISALQYGVFVSIALNFSFSPQQMASPGMVIIFITTCALNIVKLREKTSSRALYALSVFTNILCLSYSSALSCQDPHIGKVITTILMGVISLSSIWGLFVYPTKISQDNVKEQYSRATP